MTCSPYTEINNYILAYILSHILSETIVVVHTYLFLFNLGAFFVLSILEIHTVSPC